MIGRLIALSAAFLATSGLAAYGDMGPKPTIDVKFSLKPELAIVTGTLLQCRDAGCADAAPLPRRGPQGFRCDAKSCGGMAYGFSPFGMLEVCFSDGRKLRSNVFAIKDFDASYTAHIVGSALRVTPARPTGPR